MTNKQTVKGGAFLLGEADRKNLFTPEDFTSEQRQIAATTEAFVNKEILPDLERMEDQNFALVVKKLRRCAELGLFLVDIPEEFGGLELDKATSMLIAEKLGPTGSFAITCTGQTGIGSLPLVYYGTSQQKQKYLEKLITGEWIGAYCLTEPDCGSDPLSARTSAVLSEDGSCYLLNGVKQFITNAAFADLFTVFAKIDGKHFSAFLVERGMTGLSIGSEEKKMGLKGTSTAQVILQNVCVPVTNLLGEAGKGHKIAFNVLNVGRLKLSATVTGAAKGAFSEAAKYAVERKQFGQPLASFGAIREKLADMTGALFTAESLLYRVAGLLDVRIAALDHSAADYYETYQKAIEEYAGECAMAKVFCSKSLALVVDEALQIHGGYGYIKDYPIERYYRDERVNRIFEGTNEINRLLIPTLLFRRADSGELDLWDRVHAARKDFSEGIGEATKATPFATEFALLTKLKKLFLLLVGALGENRKGQEILLALGDVVIGIFALESVLLRADKGSDAASERKQTLLQAIVKSTAFTLATQIQVDATRCAAYGVHESQLAALQETIAGLAAYPVAGLLEAKQYLAAAASETGAYPF
ncbi:MAG: acyl-CoA dehydrogenase family protein [Desulfuromonadales bacterium]|nr:acyl-CoA dehydrogenase family protein [Desulfuromonadales bacterium]